MTSAHRAPTDTAVHSSDACSGPNEKQFVGTLHGQKYRCLLLLKAMTHPPSWYAMASVTLLEPRFDLLSGPPGLVLCIMLHCEAGVGCGGYTTYFDPNVCGQNKYEHDGSYGTDDDKDVTA